MVLRSQFFELLRQYLRDTLYKDALEHLEARLVQKQKWGGKLSSCGNA